MAAMVPPAEGTHEPSFRERVHRFVSAVPPGRVVTYGQVALHAGRPRAARLVGGALRALAQVDPELPWHRVVNAQGRISTYRVGAGELQSALLRAEGVAVRDGRFDLQTYLWRPLDGGATSTDV